MQWPSTGLVLVVAGAVIAAVLVLWPRLRDAFGTEDPIAPSVVLRLQDALAEHAIGDAPVAEELRDALDRSPRAVRHTREEWRRRLRAEAGEEIAAVEAALDDL